MALHGKGADTPVIQDTVAAGGVVSDHQGTAGSQERRVLLVSLAIAVELDLVGFLALVAAGRAVIRVLAATLVILGIQGLVVSLASRV